jgi:hypothetical protein
MVKATFLTLAVLTTLMTDPILLSAPQTNPKSVNIEAIVAYAYTIQVATVPGYVGEEGMAKLFFKPWQRFKWNKNYPSSLTVEKVESDVATLIKHKLGKSEFKSSGKGAVLCIPYKAKTAGRIKLKGTVSFSVCNKEECLVFRNKKVNLSLITVTKK